MRFEIVTLFPEMIDAATRCGVIGKALESGLMTVTNHQLRDYCGGSIHKVDDAPYGGGPGMVMRPEPIYAAIEDVSSRCGADLKVLMTPQGKRYDQATARRLAGYDSILLFCGRYEGVDERVRGLFDEELSVGDYVLTGGEAAALIVIESVGRLIPGVLGSDESSLDESFSAGLLEYPQYTRPEEFKGMRVPEVLTSGDHAKIERWRAEQAESRTRRRRPDLLAQKPGGERGRG